VALITIPQQTRSGEWQMTSASLAARYDTCQVTLNILPTDYVNPAKTLTLEVRTSADNGQTWQHAFGFTWVGGPRTGKDGTPNPAPMTGFSLAAYEGRRVGVFVGIPSPLTLGATVLLQ